MSSINDVVNALKAKVDELGSFIAGLQSQVDAARAESETHVRNLTAALAENHDLRNQLQAAMLPVPAALEYDPAADLRSVIDHLDVLMGRAAAPATVEPATVEPAVEAPVEPTLTLVTAEAVAVDPERHEH